MDKKKIFMIISIAILVVTIIVSGVTFAWYEWSTNSENETKIVTSMGAAKVFFDGGTSITGVNLKPTGTKEEGIVKDITVKTSKDTAYKISFNLYLDIISLDNGLKDASFKYVLYKGNTVIKEGNFLNPSTEECTINSTNHIVLVDDETITTTAQEYKLYIWIDGNMSNPNTMQSQNFNFKLHADGQNAVTGETLVQRINSLYTPNDTAINNGITYNLDTTHYLMNDRLGTNTVVANDGNIRYYGANPNNYIDIGDTELNDNGDEVPTLYRIIGLFKDVELADGTKKDLIKVIRNEPIGEYSWDQSPKNVNSGSGINEWSQADLMKLLNPNYQNEAVGGSLYWNSSSGTCYSDYTYTTDEYSTTPCDFTNIGLNLSARNKIEMAKWNLGNWEVLDIYADQSYIYERQGNVIENPADKIERTSVWLGQLALSYPSDYGYSVDLSKCKKMLWQYYDSTCISNNWMYNSMTMSGNNYGWFLSTNRGYDSDQYVYIVGESGRVIHYGLDQGLASESYGVSPVFYLDSALGIVKGDGSEGNPYVVG